jgi:uncharacterized protein (DUF433 family)
VSGITCKRGVCGSRPCFDGSRIFIECAFSFLLAGYSVEQVQREYPGLSRANVLLAKKVLVAAQASMRAAGWKLTRPVASAQTSKP